MTASVWIVIVSEILPFHVELIINFSIVNVERYLYWAVVVFLRGF